MLTTQTMNQLESLLHQQAALAPAPVTPVADAPIPVVATAPVSAWFSVSDNGVDVDPLVVMTVAPGTNRECAAVGIVDQRERPTLVQVPGAQEITATTGAGVSSTEEFVTGEGGFERRASSTAGSRYGAAKTRYVVTPSVDSSETTRFPASSPVDEAAWLRERIWRRVAMRIESLSAMDGNGSVTR
jgi:hypothetical protein